MAQVDPGQFAHVGELLDTWGHACMAKNLPSDDDCDETMRTAGIALRLEDDEADTVFCFCHKHMCEFLERIVYGRRIANVVPKEDDGDEAE